MGCFREVEWTAPVSDVNVRAPVHQMISDHNLGGCIMEERVDGNENDYQGEVMDCTLPVENVISTKYQGGRDLFLI